MARQERSKKSTAQNRVRSFQSAMLEIHPPFKLIPAEIERFDAIISSRERETWNDTDVFTAALMAQLEIEAEGLRRLYIAQGQSILDHNDKPIVNPNFTVHNTILGNLDRMRRTLGLSASQRGVSGNKQKKRDIQDAQAAKISSMQGLISRPEATKR